MPFFLKIDGVTGESDDDQHAGEIDILSIGWRVSQSSSASSPGTGAGKAAFQDLNVTMRLNAASPVLIQACAEGKRFKEAILTARKAGEDQQDFYVIKLSEVIVSNISETGDTEIVLEEVSLDYAKIEYSYKPQKSDGSLGGAVEAGWDLKTNKST